MSKIFSKVIILVFLLASLLTITGCKKKFKFNVNFYTDNQIYEVVGTNGKEVIEIPTNPTKEGYTFEGWYWDEGTWLKPFTAQSLVQTPLKEDMNVYAYFLDEDAPRGTDLKFKDGVLVEHDGIGDTYLVFVSNSTITFSFSDYVEISNKSTWTVSTDVSGNNTIASKTVELEVGNNLYFVQVFDSETNKVKQYNVGVRRHPIFTVCFNTNGGTNCEIQRVEEDSLVTEPKTSRTGYTFTGWDYDFNTPLKSDLVINANWTPNQYVITFDANGGTLSNNTMIVTYDKAYTLPTPYKVGHNFNGWYENNNKVSNSTWRNTSNITLVAKWTPNTYSINYNLNGGTINSSKPSSYTYGTTKVIPDPTKIGYEFIGWTVNESREYYKDYEISDVTYGDLELVANYKPNEYTVTLDSNGGTCIYEFIDVIYDSVVELPKPNKTGYIFNGWYYNSIKIENGIWTYGNIKLVAHWQPEIYNINYNMEGGNNNILNLSSYDYEYEELVIYAPDKVGYSFVGWTINQSDELIMNPVIKNYYGDLTLNAHFEINQYTITFSTDGGTQISSLRQDYGTNVVIPSDPTRIGYIFMGWDSEIPITIPAQDIVINAVWIDVCDVFEIIDGELISLKNVYSSKLVIPKWYIYNNKKYEIISIGSNAFKNCSSLISIEIPDSVTSIGFSAFYGCSSLTSIEIPDSVTSIGSYAFAGCDNLIKITMPLIRKPDRYLPITIKEIILTRGTEIEKSAFYDFSSLISVTIPNSVTSIGSSAFKNCSSLTSIEIPNSVTSIGSGAFSGCSSLESITLPFIGESIDCTQNTHFGYIFGTNDYHSHYEITSTLKEVIITGGTIIGPSAFRGCTNITKIIIPATVTRICDYAFDFSKNIINTDIYYNGTIENWCNISFESDVSSPMYNARKIYFKDESGGYSEPLEIDVPQSITNIGDYQFYGFEIKKISLPDTVTSIGDFSFAYCGTSFIINISDSVNYIGYRAFFATAVLNYNSLNGIKYLGSERNPYLALYQADFDIISCEINKNTKIICSDAFSSCNSLTGILIPNSVTSIGSGAFSNCNSVTNIVIPNSVTYIESATFAGCSSLTSIEIPDSVTSIGSYAFGGCSSLTSIEIPDSVTSIGSYAFGGCSSLTSIEIPDSVTSIGDYAFYICSNLTSVEIPDSVTSIGSHAFMGCSSLTSIEIPDSVTSIDKLAFYGCSSLVSIGIPDTVTSIGNSAFSGCSSLTSVEIPESVTSIGSYAFDGCNNLTIYCEVTSQPTDWDSNWNSNWNSDLSTSNRKVIWGYNKSDLDNIE